MICFFALAMVFQHGTAWSQENESREKATLQLLEGEQRLFHLPGMVKYSLGNDTLRALPVARKGALLIKAVHAGSGDLWVWNQDGSSEHRTILVSPWEAKKGKILEPLEHALSFLNESEVIPTSQGFILRGEVQSWPELERIGALVDGFPKQIQDETEPTQDLFNRGKSKLEKSLTGKEKLKLKAEFPELIVQGSVPEAARRKAIEASLKRAYPLVKLELQSLSSDNQTVHFKVYLLELKKSRFSSLGITWPGSQSGAFHVSPYGIQQSLALDLELDALEGDGSARILSNPELVVRTPGEAELFSGGELPIRTNTHFSSDVTWKPYGLTLKLKVTEVTSEKVRLEIGTEVSHLNNSQTNDSLPTIQANKMRTQVDANFGVPLLLSGLLQQEMRQEARGLPGLRNIPILGLLFGSEDYLSERSELVAILLPESKPPEDPMARLSQQFPKGPVPPPRNLLTPQSEQALRSSSNYPWNTFE